MRINDHLNDLHFIKELLSNSVVKTDIITTFFGKHLGGGCHRLVFEYNLDPKKVLKVELDNSGSNTNEYEVWDTLKWYSGPLAHVPKWFAPCHWISPCGRILLQTRTTPFYDKPEKHIPKKIPAFLTDLKPDNFGYIGNRLVCHDYPMVVCDLKKGYNLSDRISFGQ